MEPELTVTFLCCVCVCVLFFLHLFFAKFCNAGLGIRRQRVAFWQLALAASALILIGLNVGAVLNSNFPSGGGEKVEEVHLSFACLSLFSVVNVRVCVGCILFCVFIWFVLVVVWLQDALLCFALI